MKNSVRLKCQNVRAISGVPPKAFFDGPVLSDNFSPKRRVPNDLVPFLAMACVRKDEKKLTFLGVGEKFGLWISQGAKRGKTRRRQEQRDAEEQPQFLS